jgi:signal transduction histidine kinase
VGARLRLASRSDDVAARARHRLTHTTLSGVPLSESPITDFGGDAAAALGEGKSSWAPLLADALWAGVLYAVVAWLSLSLSRQPGAVASIWYANAVAMAALATRSPRGWAPQLAVVAAAMVGVNLAWGDPLALALALVPANLLEILTAVVLLRWRGFHRIEQLSAASFLGLIAAAALLPPAVGATVSAALMAGESLDDFAALWTHWFVGAAVGVVSVLPLALALRRMPAADAWHSIVRPLALLRMAGTALLTLACLSWVPFPFVYMSVLLLLAAVSVNVLTTSKMALVMSVTTAAAVATGLYRLPEPSSPVDLLWVYLALMGTLLPAQVLGVTLAELRRSHAELERHQHELSRANESLEQFVRIAAHDLREPLNTVQQFSSLLYEDHGQTLPADGQAFLDLVRKGAARMRSLLDDMLHYTRLQQQEVGEPQPVVLDEVLAEVREALAAQLRNSGGTLKAEALPVVSGHRALLSLLFQNLVSNALKFVPPGRTPLVRVYARRTPRHQEIVVSDNGIGIDPEDAHKLFMPFARLNLRRHFEGTGLGQALCRQAAQAHGGDIMVHSRPGEGSDFVLRLPR